MGNLHDLLGSAVRDLPGSFVLTSAVCHCHGTSIATAAFPDGNGCESSAFFILLHGRFTKAKTQRNHHHDGCSTDNDTKDCQKGTKLSAPEIGNAHSEQINKSHSLSPTFLNPYPLKVQ